MRIGRWEHSTKPSVFIVTENGTEIYRGNYKEGSIIMNELQHNPVRDLNNARNLPRDTPEIEIVRGKNNPVADFFSSPSTTPETDAAVRASEGQWSFILKECSQKLELELREAKEKIKAQEEQISLLKKAANFTNNFNFSEEFFQWLMASSYATCTSDIHLALNDAWESGKNAKLQQTHDC